MAEIKKETITSEIDKKNLDIVNDVSALAEQELKSFSHEYDFGAGETYIRMQQEIMSEGTSETEDKPLYQLEVSEPVMMPVIHENTETAPVKAAKLTFNLRGKLIIAVTASILALLGILLIYNAAQISNYNHAITQNEKILAEKQGELDRLQLLLNSLVNENTPESLGMAKVTETQIITLSNQIAQTNATAAHSVPTNWFDALCNFISGIFGG